MSAFPHAAGWYPRFRSKIDIWLGGALLLGILVSGAGAIGLLRQKGLASLAIIPLLATGLALRVLIDTWYGVTDTDLVVHCGPFRSTVPISSIRAIGPTRSVVSAPALSLDRLEVTHAGGTLVISPADQDGFIQALRQRHPTVTVKRLEMPLRVNSQARLLTWSLPVVTTVVLTIGGATMISGNDPLRVDVTPEAITIHGSWGTSVPIAEITAVSLVDTLPHLRRTMGYGNWNTMRGGVTSRELGERGHAYVTRRVAPVVVVVMRNGFLVFNTDDPARTRRLFEELRSAVGASPRTSRTENRANGRFSVGGDITPTESAILGAVARRSRAHKSTANASWDASVTGAGVARCHRDPANVYGGTQLTTVQPRVTRSASSNVECCLASRRW